MTEKIACELSTSTAYKKCLIVDTPGLDDDNDKCSVEKLCQFLIGCNGINAFILVQNGINNRAKQSFKEKIREFERCFGVKQFWNHLIIVVTHWDLVKPRKQEDVLCNLKKGMNDDFKESKNYKFPILPIGEGKEFDKWNHSLLQRVNKEKSICDDMKFPLNERRIQQKKLQTEEHQCNMDIKALDDKITSNENRKKQLQNELKLLCT